MLMKLVFIIIIIFILIFPGNIIYSLSPDPIVDAGACVLVEINSGRILFQKNADKRMNIASTTKIITAITAMENGNLDDEVIISERAAYIWGSQINLKPGEKLKLEDLLYGLLLKSGNDAAIAIAELISGDVESFVELMNVMVRKIGAFNTNFANPHGLDAQDHYSTANDMALITRYSLGNKIFSKIVGTKEKVIAGGRYLSNTNELLGVLAGVNGVKTGYTSLAGRCLITSAVRDEMTLVAVVLNCATKAKRTISSSRLLEWGFKNFKIVKLVEAGEIINSINVKKGLSDNIRAIAAKNVELPLSNDEIQNIEFSIAMPDILKPPIYKGEYLGKLRFFSGESVMAEVELLSESEVLPKKFINYFQDVLDTLSKML